VEDEKIGFQQTGEGGAEGESLADKPPLFNVIFILFYDVDSGIAV
jgi:hypothetical protein